tara:strand:+ start:1416 stop:2081 length:666 start_codon:yes stop_codon:yes gene_type:complete
MKIDIIKANIKHWNKFYSKKKHPIKTSNFAKFLYKKFLIKGKGKKLIDIGCGNGRDSFFFADKKFNVTSLDRSDIAVRNNLIYKEKYRYKNINFIKLDINKKSILKGKKYDYIYLRFFVHAITHLSQRRLFKLLNRIGKKHTSLIMLEFRTISDELMKKGKIISNCERIDNHYRRFINTKDFIKEFMSFVKCKIVYFQEGKGMSIFKKDNPHLCRLVFKKK